MEVDVDTERYFGFWKRVSKSVQLLLHGVDGNYGTDFDNSEIASPVKTHYFQVPNLFLRPRGSKYVNVEDSVPTTTPMQVWGPDTMIVGSSDLLD